VAANAEVIRDSVISVNFVRRGCDVTEMTLKQTTVFLEGDNGGNTADANGYKHNVTEGIDLKFAVLYIYIYMTQNLF
jgi:hypothetical protein